MRRSFALSAVALALLGLELAAGAVSLSLERLLAGTAAMLRGEGGAFPGYRMIAGWALIAGAVAVAGAVAWADRTARVARDEGAGCPRCGAATRRIRRRRRHRLLAHLLEEGLTRRSCGECGWTGLAART